MKRIKNLKKNNDKATQKYNDWDVTRAQGNNI